MDLIWVLVVIFVVNGEVHLDRHPETFQSMTECFEIRDDLKYSLPKYGNQIVCIPEELKGQKT